MKEKNDTPCGHNEGLRVYGVAIVEGLVDSFRDFLDSGVEWLARDSSNERFECRTCGKCYVIGDDEKLKEVIEMEQNNLKCPQCNGDSWRIDTTAGDKPSEATCSSCGYGTFV